MALLAPGYVAEVSRSRVPYRCFGCLRETVYYSLGIVNVVQLLVNVTNKILGYNVTKPPNFIKCTDNHLKPRSLETLSPEKIALVSLIESISLVGGDAKALSLDQRLPFKFADSKAIGDELLLALLLYFEHSPID